MVHCCWCDCVIARCAGVLGWLESIYRVSAMVREDMTLEPDPARLLFFFSLEIRCNSAALWRRKGRIIAGGSRQGSSTSRDTALSRAMYAKLTISSRLIHRFVLVEV
jgi:hypothetical protein